MIQKKLPEIETISQLVQWMKDNCYNFESYSINGNHIWEGFIIDRHNSTFRWQYTERGEIKTLDVFTFESDIVKHALKAILSDKYANVHFVAMLETIPQERTIRSLTNELEKREVQFFTDKIPYNGRTDSHTRIYVVGCDVLKVKDLQERYK